MYELDNTVTVIDGSFTSQLQLHVTDEIEGDPLWSSRFLYTDPEAVIRTHSDFLNAGADIIETNTYQASIKNFMKYLKLSEEKSFNLIKTSVDLAKIAVDRFRLKSNRKVLVAGSIGPYGVHLHDGSEYTGNYVTNVSLDVMREWHRPRIAALVEAGVDLLAIETQPSKVEAAMLVELIKQFPSCKAWLSFSCRDDGCSISCGDKFQDVARYCYNLNKYQLIAVGVNCLHPRHVEHLFEGFNKVKQEPIPLIVYPNSGERYDQVNKCWTDKCENLAQYVPKWLDMGVRYVGGCCRVRAESIGAIQRAVDKWVSSQ